MPAGDSTMIRIPEELAGKHVFVTGGSGFMGKVLLEKLLRSCPDVECVYVLLRPKKGVAVEDRLKNIVGVKLFEPLLAQSPGVVSKLRAVQGDCSLLGLGLSAEDEALLVDNVSYVFHAAATVRFDDPLKSALLLNTRGTREVVDLCRKMTKLKVLEYVSTTYCFANEPLLREQHYPTDIDWRTMVRLAESEDQSVLDAFTAKILDFQPNTYTFTKALAENIINDARDDIPVIIFRPAVVINTIAEPFSGWLDNLNGPFAIWVGACKGVLRFSYGDPDVALAFTPVDWAIRGMIVCAVARACRSPALESTPGAMDVVHLEGTKYEKLTYQQQAGVIRMVQSHAGTAIRYPSYSIGTSYVYYWLGTVFSELTYGLAIDILLRLSGRKPRMVATYRKIFHANEALCYFMHNEFPIETKKSDALQQVIHPKDRTSFGLIPGDESGFHYDPSEFPKIVIAGASKYVFKENITPEENKRIMQKLFILEVFLYLLWALPLSLTVGTYLLGRFPGLIPSG